MLLDDVAIYSVTDARTADRITKTALALPGGPHREVCDGCACVGGNVISFARALRKGGRVTGIEFDATRCEFLRHNVAAAGVPDAEYLRAVARAEAQVGRDGAAHAEALLEVDVQKELEPELGVGAVAVALALRGPLGLLEPQHGGGGVGERRRRWWWC